MVTTMETMILKLSNNTIHHLKKNDIPFNMNIITYFFQNYFLAVEGQKRVNSLKHCVWSVVCLQLGGDYMDFKEQLN